MFFVKYPLDRTIKNQVGDENETKVLGFVFNFACVANYDSEDNDGRDKILWYRGKKIRQMHASNLFEKSSVFVIYFRRGSHQPKM